MLRKIFIVTVFYFICPFAFAQITVSPNGRFLQTETGEPFFWLGDTDWEMFHRLTREEIEHLLDTRKAQGFNVIQAVALAEMNGIKSPNRYGDLPLVDANPEQLAITDGNNPSDQKEYDYWDHVDFAIEAAAKRGIYIGLLPTWGDKLTHNWGDGPVIFTEKNAEVYGEILAKRYASNKNVLWILGGDRPAVYKSRKVGEEKEYNDVLIWGAMAQGIQNISGNKAFITYHPSGGERSTSQYIHKESWLDMNAFQSGHFSRDSQPWKWVQRDLELKPTKPTLDMEPCYEDHPVNPWDNKWTRKERGYFHSDDVRARIYRTVFAGGCGVTYGHHQVWQFFNPEINSPIFIGDTVIGWRKALEAEAASQMQYLKALMLSRPYFNRVMDQKLIKSNVGSTYVDQIIATRDSDGSYAMIYLPQNSPVTIDLSLIAGTNKNQWWFDPRTGKTIQGPVLKNKKQETFSPPQDGKDWVLVLDNADKKFGAPGGLR